MIADYKIESDLDRRLLLGVLVRDCELRRQEGARSSYARYLAAVAASGTTEIQPEDISVLENNDTTYDHSQR